MLSGIGIRETLLIAGGAGLLVAAFATVGLRDQWNAATAPAPVAEACRREARACRAGYVAASHGVALLRAGEHRADRLAGRHLGRAVLDDPHHRPDDRRVELRAGVRHELRRSRARAGSAAR